MKRDSCNGEIAATTRNLAQVWRSGWDVSRCRSDSSDRGGRPRRHSEQRAGSSCQRAANLDHHVIEPVGNGSNGSNGAAGVNGAKSAAGRHRGAGGLFVGPAARKPAGPRGSSESHRGLIPGRRRPRRPRVSPHRHETGRPPGPTLCPVSCHSGPGPSRLRASDSGKAREKFN
jgi:hypothetical protein